MKRYIVNILLFFLIIAAIDFAIGKLGDYLQTHAKCGETRSINDLVLKDCHDIVILGSSRAHHHYDTPFLSDTLGLDVYNAGYDGNGVVLAYGLLEMILNRYRPKLIIYDVEPAFDIYVYNNDNQHKRYISLLKPYYKNDVVGNVIKDVSIEEWYKVHSGLLRYNSNLVSKVVDNFFSRSLFPKGYHPLVGQYTSEPDTSNTKTPRIDMFKLQYVDKLLQLAKSHDVPLIVVASPKYGANSSDIIYPVIEICNKHNVPFLDYYADVTFIKHKELFKEPMHLNQEGARLFSETIIEEIMQIIKY